VYAEIVAILLEAGADPSNRDADGITAVEHARASNDDDIARLLEAATR